MRKYAIALAAVLLAGCNMVSDPVVDGPRPRLEIEYVNYAWGKVYNGWFVNESGEVLKYDRKGETWPKSADSTGTVQDLYDKYLQRTTLDKHAPDAATLASQIDAVDPQAMTPQQGRCADAGVLSYYAYDYNGDRYTRLLLWRAGDVMQKNLSPAAQQLVTYIRSLNLTNEITGCAP